MRESFLSTIYGTILTPFQTFDSLKIEENQRVFEAFWIVMIVSIIGCINDYHSTNMVLLAVSIFSYIVTGLISWILIATILDSITMVFTKVSKFDTFLTLSGFALLPWILMGPISLFKTAGIFGYLIAIALGLIVWFWTVVLFLVAIYKTYDLSLGKTFVLVIAPFVTGLIALAWIVGFLSNVISILGPN